jgi:hypothetical protein
MFLIRNNLVVLKFKNSFGPFESLLKSSALIEASLKTYYLELPFLRNVFVKEISTISSILF